MTKLQFAAIGAVVVTGSSALIVQQQSNSRLNGEIALLRSQAAAASALHVENQRLSQAIAEGASLSDAARDLPVLRVEESELNARLQAAKVGAGIPASGMPDAASPNKAGKGLEIFDISKVDRPPVPTFQARPQYPFDMRRTGTSGTVIVDFIVDATGAVRDAFAADSTQKEFEAAAVQAVGKWRFRPGGKGGRDVNTHMQVPIRFTLDDGNGAMPAWF